ncbi:MAG: hypothetical protein WD045_17020 [Pirellulaceae bacterium]
MEIWLNGNRRPFIATAVVLLVAALVCMLVGGLLLSAIVPRLIVLVVGIVASLGAVLLAFQTMRPRIAFAENTLHLYLDWAGVSQVPVEIVECFFLGQDGPHDCQDKSKRPVTAAVVIRLADRAKPWHRGHANPQIGLWEEGYITIRGSWAEPINQRVVERLNERLRAVHRAQATQPIPEPAAKP